MKVTGKVSHFGGPNDTGVSPSEGLAFIFDVSDKPELFLPAQPAGTTGLARRLDPEVPYVACRWDYSAPYTSKEELLKHIAVVRNPKTGKELRAFPADWGPNENTGRVADISPGLMEALDLTTDDVVEVTYPDPTEPAMAIINRVAISSGHSTKCQGAIGPSPWGLNEVAEATRVADRVAQLLNAAGVETRVFHDTQSTNSSTNLDTIIDWHNHGDDRDLDVSVHFNAHSVTDAERGVEVLWYTQEDLARKISAAIAEAADFIDRGPKYRDDLAFLLHTDQKSVLIETCFVDAQGDVEKYHMSFEDICVAIASAIAGVNVSAPPPLPEVTVSVQAPDGVTLRLLINGEEVLLGRDDG